MVRDSSAAGLLRLIVAAIVVLALAIVSRRAGADETLLLEVVVNGYSTGKIGEFVMRDGALHARPEELRDLGIRVPKPVPLTKDGLVALSALPGVTTRLDQATQTLHVTAKNAQLLPAVLQTKAGVPKGPPVESGLGAMLNYDVAGTTLAGGSTSNNAVASGLFDLRAFSPWGVVSTDYLAFSGSGPQGPGGNSAVRLDSTYEYSDPDSLRRYRLGDSITGGLSWTRQVRFGGVQIDKDFSMRPDLITFPLPTVVGSVAVPSTVDLMVNGAQLFSRQLQPGPFEIPHLPVLTGAGTVAMTLTDAVGHQVTTTVPFYASSNLLDQGLQTYSAEVGAIRNNWGVISNDYGNAAASATYRRGLTPNITIEAHGEGSSGLFMAGGGLVMNAFNLGVVNLSAAASTASSRTGAQFGAGFQRIGRVLSLGASAIIADHNFRDIAALNGDPVPRRQLNANVGLSLGRFGSFAVAYIGLDRDATPAPVRFFVPAGTFIDQTNVVGGTLSTSGSVVSFVPAQHAKILTASYSVQIRNFSIYATGFHDFVQGGNTGVLFGVTVPLGVRSSISGSVGAGTGGANAQVQASQSVVSIGDFGYQVFGSAGQTTHEFAQLQYKSPWGLVSGGADRIGSQTAFRAEAQGALAYADGGVFASNTINDAFAVVDTGGTKGIRVLSENREAGRTDSAGRLLVPDLRSFDVNHISIDPTDVPADEALAFDSREVRPQDRSGVVVKFAVHASHGALLKLVDPAGNPIPPGSTGTLKATGTTVPVGFDGDAYVENLSEHNELAVELPDGRRCAVRFDYRAKKGEIPTIGPLTCGENRP